MVALPQGAGAQTPAAKSLRRPVLQPLAVALMGMGVSASPLLPAHAAEPSPPAAVELAQDPDTRLSTVKVESVLDEDRNSVQATDTTIGKGRQQLRDIPQSVTVVTERLIDDRKLDTVKEALRNTAGITFLAAEGGEEDIRLRGFSLQSTGDIFLEGLRDPAIYDRDTFALDRLEVLRGSASMLFGRGSTGGAVNQVTKQPTLVERQQVDVTVGQDDYLRVVGDFSLRTGEDQALRLNAMKTDADNDGRGNSLNKRGIAASYGLNLGGVNEIVASLYHLDNENGVNYGLPFVSIPNEPNERALMEVDQRANYGLESDINKSDATVATLAHTHRLSMTSELKTQLRVSEFSRDLRSGAIRFAPANLQPNGEAVDVTNISPNTVLNRGTHIKKQDMNVLQLQSDYTTKFEALGLKHSMIAGVDVSREEKTVFAARNAAQGGVDITKPRTTVGNTSPSGFVDEASRVFRVNNAYESLGYGAFVQDMMELTPTVKLVGGVRYDRLKGEYQTFQIDSANPTGPEIPNEYYEININEFSYRGGLLYQPTARQSYHLSAATSFNTSGDAYSLNAGNAGIDPEESMNFELGAKLDSSDGRFSTRLAVFQSTKLKERNTDPLLPVTVLTGKRRVRGFEADVAGRLTPEWEVFASTTWLPYARVLEAAPCPPSGQCVQAAVGERPGDRPALTPRFSGTVFSTYQVSPAWRLGGGLNVVSEQRPTRVAFSVPSYVTVDLFAEYTAIPDRLVFKANLNNLTDKLYAEQLYPAHYIPGQGRQLFLTASLMF